MARETNTGLKGVRQRTDGGASAYESYVLVGGQRVFYGGFPTLAKAVEARKDFIISLL